MFDHGPYATWRVHLRSPESAAGSMMIVEFRPVEMQGLLILLG